MMTEAEVRALANAILAEKLGPSGFVEAEVEAGADQDGDESFFITARFRPEFRIPSGRDSIEVRTELHDALLARREERFPYISYEFPGGEAPLSDDLDEADDAEATPSS